MCKTNHPGSTRRFVASATLGLALAAGCGAELDGFLSDLNLFPNADSITEEIHDACAGVMTDEEIVSALVAARLDRLNGYTKDEERATALQNCTVDALFGGAAINACMACKDAILDEIFGP